MELDEKPETSASAANVLTPSDRIAELNKIDKSVTQLLESASTAIAILSGSNDQHTSGQSLDKTQEAFRVASAAYFSTLSSIEVRLRRQVYALEEAGLISAGSERDARRGRTLNTNVDGAESDVGGSGRRAVGGGPLDPSWLNARISNSVEVKKRLELLEEGKELVEHLNQQANNITHATDKMDQNDG